MAMEFARAFIDLHHTVSEDILYADNDFPLVVDDGTGSPAIHPDLANNVPAWNLTPTEIQNLGILMGWATRSLNFAGGVDNTIGIRNGLPRVAYLIMGRDPDSGNIIDPTWVLRSPSQGNQLVIDFDTNGNANEIRGRGSSTAPSRMPIFGGCFCDQNGIPKTVYLGGNNKIMFGITWDIGTIQLATGTPNSYPNSPEDPADSVSPTTGDNAKNFSFFGPSFNLSGERRRLIIDRDSGLIADILDDANETLTGPFQVSDNNLDTLFDRNNDDINIMPLLHSTGFENAGGNIDFDWDIFYRNRSDA